MTPQEYAKKAKDWCSLQGAPVVIKRDEHRDAWRAWHGYFVWHRMKWSADMMAGQMSSFTVPSAFPWDFDAAYSQYDAMDRDRIAEDERLGKTLTPERRQYILDNIGDLVDEYRRKNPKWLRQCTPAMLRPYQDAAE